MDMDVVRSCPKCGGTVYRYFSIYHGWRDECFRCGHHTKLQTMFEAEDSMKEGNLGQAGGSAQIRK